tara:strand:+ start:2582 stop:2776 length:195 start_codon:yes stop_codon:yes gene_type:complete
MPHALAAAIIVHTEYTPANLTTDLAAGVATVLPWVGAGVGGGVILMFAFMGIRKGFAFFKSVAK